MNIFPFTLEPYTGRQLFRAYVDKNIERLNKTYGSLCLTTVNGVTGFHQLWHWHDVEVEALSPTAVRFTTFDRLSEHEGGGRGQVQEQFGAACKPEALEAHIVQRKRQIATDVYHARRAAEAARLEADAITTIEKELFE